MKTKVINYLKRDNCLDCKIDDSGKLKHCEKCESLFILALTEAEEWAKLPDYEQKKRLQIEQDLFISEAKKSHDWVAARSYNISRTSMTPFTSHCRKCGLQMVMFKISPSQCPSK